MLNYNHTFNIIKNKTITSPALDGEWEATKIQVSLFNVGGELLHNNHAGQYIIGVIRTDGLYTVWHRGQKQYIQKLWDKKYKNRA